MAEKLTTCIYNPQNENPARRGKLYPGTTSLLLEPGKNILSQSQVKLLKAYEYFKVGVETKVFILSEAPDEFSDLLSFNRTEAKQRVKEEDSATKLKEWLTAENQQPTTRQTVIKAIEDRLIQLDTEV